ncbi:OmpW family protein [Massilia sp. YIM B02443]|uniref:OmpW/AlkL family protein n=1 Tax=Massilia sp. YIM B02443 TaxID=3050127 RepID=UPI0025B64ED0|nr:OmpW family outer membrane protein [Massilia sp. YIM B02443]MDN4037165.1 OmpW family outer membrane protein [Massilia sp. YIM B02443]
MKTMMKSVVVALIAVAASQAIAQESPWLVRARAVYIDPDNKSTPVGGVGASDRIDVETKTIPELDISYFFTPHISAELILTYPQKHKVRLDGAEIGSFKHLPPTLTAQYHFAPGATINPYVGVGVNYTRISKVRLLDGAGDLENDSWGLALQAGVDFRINERWSINADVKKVNIRSDVYVGGANASHLKVDPVLFGLGVGYRF